MDETRALCLLRPTHGRTHSNSVSNMRACVCESTLTELYVCMYVHMYTCMSMCTLTHPFCSCACLRFCVFCRVIFTQTLSHHITGEFYHITSDDATEPRNLIGRIEGIFFKAEKCTVRLRWFMHASDIFDKDILPEYLRESITSDEIFMTDIVKIYPVESIIGVKCTVAINGDAAKQEETEETLEKPTIDALNAEGGPPNSYVLRRSYFPRSAALTLDSLFVPEIEQRRNSGTRRNNVLLLRDIKGEELFSVFDHVSPVSDFKYMKEHVEFGRNLPPGTNANTEKASAFRNELLRFEEMIPATLRDKLSQTWKQVRNIWIMQVQVANSIRDLAMALLNLEKVLQVKAKDIGMNSSAYRDWIDMLYAVHTYAHVGRHINVRLEAFTCI